MNRAELLAYIDSNVYPNANNEITALMERDVLHRIVGFMGDAATYGVGDVAQSDPGLVTGGAVQGAINSALSSVLKFVGVTTTVITDGSTTNPVIINESSYTAVTGNVVLYDAKEYLWTGSAWEEMGGRGELGAQDRHHLRRDWFDRGRDVGSKQDYRALVCDDCVPCPGGLRLPEAPRGHPSDRPRSGFEHED
jgi:hypothetical protein